MAAMTEIRTSMDAELTAEASAIFEAAGFTLTDAVRMMLLRTVAERGLPFDPLVPNAETAPSGTLPGDANMHPQLPKGSIEGFIGLFKGRLEKPISIQEMNEAIADGWAGVADPNDAHR